MKSLRDILRKNPEIADDLAVQELLAYCEELENEVIDLRFEKSNSKELILLDMIREVIKSSNALDKEQMEHERFGYPAPDYAKAVNELKWYILKRCQESKIYL
jgi:hypothetical protein